MRFFCLIFFLVYLISIESCRSKTQVDYYNEILIKSVKGVITNKTLYKGGLLVIEIGNDNISLNNDVEILNEIKKRDFFVKLANTNKCSIQRNDSIFYFDCINLERLNKEDRKKLINVKQWNNNKINLPRWRGQQ